jgi:hypothetical protein
MTERTEDDGEDKDDEEEEDEDDEEEDGEEEGRYLKLMCWWGSRNSAHR